MSLIKKSILNLIRLYQRSLSPDHGFMAHRHPYGYCRFSPSCSEYAYQAVQRYGVGRGLWQGVKRILRCNPFNAGGYDPIK